MKELKQMIDDIDDNTELNGAKLKELLLQVIDFCEFEMSNKQRMFDFITRMREYEKRATHR